MAFTLARGEHLAGGGIDLVQVRGADETLEHRDVRTVRRIQGETFREDLEQAGVVGFGMLEHRGVRLQQDVNGRDRGLLGREDRLPVVLHADDGPAILLRLFVQRRREGAEFDVRQSECRTVGVFARRIIVQHQQLEPRAAAALRVFQHLLVAVGIAERGDGPAADVLVDADGLAGLCRH